MDYQQIGKILETTGKDIQKLNNKLDKILEKLLEVESVEERKTEAVEHIQADRIGDAIDLLKLVEKDQARAETLKAEEAKLREQLEALRTQASDAAAGQTQSGPQAVESGADSESNSDAA